MRALITGITGFAGSHLADYLRTLDDVEVFGIYRWRSRLDNLHHLGSDVNLIEPGLSNSEIVRKSAISGKVNIIGCDLRDITSMKKTLEAVRPDRIFHLASQSYVPASWNAPADTFEINVIGQINLFEAIRDTGLDPLVHIAGSSEEYGMVYEDELPIKETNPLRPLSPYAVTKVAQEKLAYQYYMSYGLKAVTSRGFNHEGPRRGEVFVTSNFARQIAMIEKGRQEPVLCVGDLSCRRDWTDVRDMVKAYHLLLEKGQPGDVYNIGSGVTRTVQSMLDLLLQNAKVSIDVRQDPARLRPSDVKVLQADYSKFKAATGWEPFIPFEKTMKDLLDYWRERI
ncbi:MAG: GDP-mannose 4,6-dehydratase [Chloroflexi bacterium]|nr:GDP-mannose 4,6-dehydratase [Chloroflexota bacterium]